MSEVKPYPLAVVLHGRNYGNGSDLLRRVGWDIPHSFTSFTDTLTQPNPLSERLLEFVRAADALFIQEDLIYPPTPDAQVALNGLRVVGKNCKTDVYSFGSGAVEHIGIGTLQFLRSQTWQERDPEFVELLGGNK